MPISQDPEKRAIQLRNLHPEPGSDAWHRQRAGLRKGSESSGTAKPGDARRLLHGGRTMAPQNGPEWSPAVREAIRALEAECVGVELLDERGELHGWVRPAVECVALAQVTAWRADRWLATREAKGTVTGEDFDIQGRAN